MKTISIALHNDDFFCPFTGQRILGPETYNRSSSLIGLWHYDNIREPDLHDIELMAEWETFLNGRGHFQLDEFFEHVKNDDWYVFILNSKTAGCAELTTLAIVLNADC